MNVFELMAKISLDTSEYEKNLNEAKEAGSTEGQNVGEAIGKGVDSGASTGIGSLVKKIAKIGGSVYGLKKAADFVFNIGKQAFDQYADYEQLVGGVETLFNSDETFANYKQQMLDAGMSIGQINRELADMKSGSDIVLENAANAYKTAGLSANEYMETVTSFSASLIQSLGGDTVKAARYADMAITDMSDNANKMGSDMESIQNAYQGFAKQNYTMLDNLKLGYGGTKTEMERLITDAEKLNSGFKAARDENGKLALSYSDVVDAIHIVQTDMGITGTTAQEASNTISGSIASMKSAWANWLTSLGDENGNVEETTHQLVETFITVVKNAAPVAWEVAKGLGKAIVEGLGTLGSMMADKGRELFGSFWQGVVDVANQITAWVSNWWQNLWSNKTASAGGGTAIGAYGGRSGTFAGGLDYVPYNGFSATLHKGESVLTAREAEQWRSGNGRNGYSDVPQIIAPLVINVTEKIDGMTLAENQYRFNLEVTNRHGIRLINA